MLDIDIEKGYNLTKKNLKLNYEINNLQNIKTRIEILSINEFKNLTKLSFPIISYFFKKKDNIIENYGNLLNYNSILDISKNIIKKDNNLRHIPYSISCDTNFNLNNKILNNLLLNFTISIWIKLSDDNILDILNIKNNTNLLNIYINTDNKLYINFNNKINNNEIELSRNNWIHLLIIKKENSLDLYKNNIKYENLITDLDKFDIINLDDNIVELGKNIEYLDLRIFDYDINLNIDLFYKIGNPLNIITGNKENNINNHHLVNYIDKDYIFPEINISTKTKITICFWLLNNSLNDNLILTINNLKIGKKENKLYIKYENNYELYSNKIIEIYKWNFISICIENKENELILDLRIDNCLNNSDSFYGNFNMNIIEITNLLNNDIIEDFRIYDYLNNNEIYDIYISILKLYNNDIKELRYNSELFYYTNIIKNNDLEIIDSIKNENTEEKILIKNYSYKKEKYGGYNNFINDLSLWYKFNNEINEIDEKEKIEISNIETQFPPSSVIGLPSLNDDDSQKTYYFDLMEANDMTYPNRERYESENTIVGFSQFINNGLYEFRTNNAGATNGKFYRMFTDDVYNWYMVFGEFTDSTGLYNAIGYNDHDLTKFSDGTSQRGIWVEVGVPNKIVLTKYSFRMNDNDNYRNIRSIEQWIICGSNDRKIWTKIHDVPNDIVAPDEVFNIPANLTDIIYQTFDRPLPYKYIRKIYIKMDDPTWFAHSSLKLYGYETITYKIKKEKILTKDFINNETLEIINNYSKKSKKIWNI
jgi:hypothetical protein